MAIQHVTAHPLEPLAPAELERAADLVRGRLDGARFVSIGLQEPPKASYHAWLAGGPRPPRCALAIAVDREHCVRELVCDLPAVRYIRRGARTGLPVSPFRGSQARRPTRGKRFSGKVSTCGERCWWSTPPST